MPPISMQQTNTAAHAAQVSRMASMFPSLSSAAHTALASVDLAVQSGAIKLSQLVLPAAGAALRGPAAHRVAGNLVGAIAKNAVKKALKGDPKAERKEKEEQLKKAKEAEELARERNERARQLENEARRRNSNRRGITDDRLDPQGRTAEERQPETETARREKINIGIV